MNPNENGGISITLTDKTDQLIPVDKLTKSKKNLIIFDDCVNQRNQRNRSLCAGDIIAAIVYI